MTHDPDLSTAIAVVTGLLLVLGAGLAATGSLGLLRLASFYQRIHATTLGTTLGMGSVLIGSMFFFSATQTRVVLHELIIAAVMVMSTPISLMLLVRAALYRDRGEGSSEVPPLP
jgi:multicomponent K+:H+ antiporter subunit G